ncbi:expressed unknown protein [Seminavis robusta]|uniref:Uncharacterized protein n=1 Tax=Seminavis robusta TaxID=568900 RepID=A0A9N8EQL5_9STRA|nr:expressed unknown protein [Seminavis robusta]|eukprot:Sro1560_g282530.1 n/a (1093) ;mRNA; r:8345-11623
MSGWSGPGLSTGLSTGPSTPVTANTNTAHDHYHHHPVHELEEYLNQLIRSIGQHEQKQHQVEQQRHQTAQYGHGHGQPQAQAQAPVGSIGSQPESHRVVPEWLKTEGSPPDKQLPPPDPARTSRNAATEGPGAEKFLRELEQLIKCFLNQQKQQQTNPQSHNQSTNRAAPPPLSPNSLSQDAESRVELLRRAVADAEAEATARRLQMQQQQQQHHSHPHKNHNHNPQLAEDAQARVHQLQKAVAAAEAEAAARAFPQPSYQGGTSPEAEARAKVLQQARAAEEAEAASRALLLQQQQQQQQRSQSWPYKELQNRIGQHWDATMAENDSLKHQLQQTGQSQNQLLAAKQAETDSLKYRAALQQTQLQHAKNSAEELLQEKEALLVKIKQAIADLKQELAQRKQHQQPHHQQQTARAPPMPQPHVQVPNPSQQQQPPRPPPQPEASSLLHHTNEKEALLEKLRQFMTSLENELGRIRTEKQNLETDLQRTQMALQAHQQLHQTLAQSFQSTESEIGAIRQMLAQVDVDERRGGTSHHHQPQQHQTVSWGAPLSNHGGAPLPPTSQYYQQQQSEPTMQQNNTAATMQSAPSSFVPPAAAQSPAALLSSMLTAPPGPYQLPNPTTTAMYSSAPAVTNYGNTVETVDEQEWRPDEQAAAMASANHDYWQQPQQQQLAVFHTQDDGRSQEGPPAYDQHYNHPTQDPQGYMSQGEHFQNPEQAPRGGGGEWNYDPPAEYQSQAGFISTFTEDPSYYPGGSVGATGSQHYDPHQNPTTTAGNSSAMMPLSHDRSVLTESVNFDGGVGQQQQQQQQQQPQLSSQQYGAQPLPQHNGDWSNPADRALVDPAMYSSNLTQQETMSRHSTSANQPQYTPYEQPPPSTNYIVEVPTSSTLTDTVLPPEPPQYRPTGMAFLQQQMADAVEDARHNTALTVASMMSSSSYGTPPVVHKFPLQPAPMATMHKTRNNSVTTPERAVPHRTEPSWTGGSMMPTNNSPSLAPGGSPSLVPNITRKARQLAPVLSYRDTVDHSTGPNNHHYKHGSPNTKGPHPGSNMHRHYPPSSAGTPRHSNRTGGMTSTPANTSNNNTRPPVNRVRVDPS